MTGVEGYAGTPANGNSKRYFGGNYDGDGYTLTVDLKGNDQTSIFPYVYGVFTNLVLKGRISSPGSAQPFRTLQTGSVIANSVMLWKPRALLRTDCVIPTTERSSMFMWAERQEKCFALQIRAAYI